MARVKFIRPRDNRRRHLGMSGINPNRPFVFPGSQAMNEARNNGQGAQDAVDSQQTMSNGAGQDNQVPMINPASSNSTLLPTAQSTMQRDVEIEEMEAAAITGLLLLGAASRQDLSSPQAPFLPQASTTASRTVDPSASLTSLHQGDSLQGNAASPKRVKRETGSTGKTKTSPQPKPSVSTNINSSQGSSSDTITMQMPASSATRAMVSRTGQARFCIFEAILQHTYILFQFADCLELDDLLSLYTISKDFHRTINTALTAVILTQAMRYAPTAATIFPFRCYRKLCIDDPRVELDQSRPQSSRLIPSFRWLRMVCWREKTVQKICMLLNNQGLYVPRQCETVIKKIWFLMDVPDNQRRIAIIQNPQLWSSPDLFYAITFFMRIDMKCTRPTAMHSHGCIRRILLAQPSMSVLCRTLEGTFLKSKEDAIKAYLRWKYIAQDNDPNPVFGIPRNKLGRLQYENYGVGGSMVKLQRPDELVMKECVRRGLDMKPAFFPILNWTGEKLETEDKMEGVENVEGVENGE